MLENNEVTKQAPIHSGFGARTTAKQAIEGEDLNGKVVIVTGDIPV